MTNNPWMQTLNGCAFDLLDPQPDQIDFHTIATVLARVPRFGGHTNGGVLSVAQHCIEGAAAIIREGGDREVATAFLLHDAHEAYIGDITSPVAEALQAIGAGYAIKTAITSLKRRVDRAIYTAAGLSWPLLPSVALAVRAYDLRMLRTERDYRLDIPPRSWGDIEYAAPVAGVDLYPWSEGSARMFYLTALADYGLVWKAAAA